MSKVAKIKSELKRLSQAEQRDIRNHLDNLIEDNLEFTPEFESTIQQSEREIKPQGGQTFSSATAYLLHSPVNARRLLAATQQLAARKGKTHKRDLGG